MKIVHLTPNFYPVTGGIETFVYEISKRLVKEGQEITVITRIPPWDKKLPRYEIIDGIEVLRFPFNMIFRYSFSLEALKTVLKKEFDIIHIHVTGLLTDIIPILRIKNKKIFVHTHGGIFHTPYANVLKQVYFKTFLKFDLKFADKIIAHSLHDKILFSSICDRKKIALINYGIDWKLLSKLKRRSNGRTLIYTGRLAKNKRIDRMLHVLCYLKKEIPGIKLLLVGSDWGEKDNLKKLAERFGLSKNIVFTGPVPHKNIPKYLSQADIFLLSSEYEGFGISVIEAMASGLPVVVNNIEPMREIVKNGKNGFTSNFDDYKKTAKIILKILKNKKLRKKIDKNAKSYSEKFDWNNIIRNLKKIYFANLK